jgi:hypothetical protein
MDELNKEYEAAIEDGAFRMAEFIDDLILSQIKGDYMPERAKINFSAALNAMKHKYVVVNLDTSMRMKVDGEATIVNASTGAEYLPNMGDIFGVNYQVEI